jgi:hypothetical protein
MRARHGTVITLAANCTSFFRPGHEKYQKFLPKADPPLAEKINPSTLLRVDGEQSRTIKYQNLG